MKNSMNKTNHILLIFFAIVLSIFVTSCTTKKSVTKSSLREFTASKLIKEVENNEFVFDNFQAKVNLKIETNNKNFNLKGQLRMQHDSVIWVSVALPLGLEMIRIKIQPDSVYFINRTDKTYFCEDINMFSDISPMITSIGFLQSMLVGNDLNLRESDNYKVQIDNGQYNLLISHKLKKSIKQKDDDWKVMLKYLWIDPNIFKITKYNIREYNDNKRKIGLQYSDFEKVNGKYVPTKIKINIHGDTYLKVSIDYSNIIVNDNIDFYFNVPNKYDRIYR